MKAEAKTQHLRKCMYWVQLFKKFLSFQQAQRPKLFNKKADTILLVTALFIYKKQYLFLNNIALSGIK